MIVFTSNPNIITQDFIEENSIPSVEWFNLSSPINFGNNFKYINPASFNPTEINDPNFDISYRNYIFSNNDAINELIYIMRSVYYGGIIVILIDESTHYRRMLNEAFASLISYAYEYPVTYAENTDELDPNNSPNFSLVGLINFDKQNKEITKTELERMKSDERRSFME